MTGRTALALMVAASGAARAQTNEPLPRPIDQGYSDVSPLQTSLKIQQIDLRLPTGFGQVYRVPGSDTLFSRTDGALTAVFPQSSYIATREGTRPIVPADTLFVIGPLPGGVNQTPAPAREHLYAVRREADAPPLNTKVLVVSAGPRPVSTDASSYRSVGPVRTEPVEVTIWNDARYRQHRIGALLRAAAQADR